MKILLDMDGVLVNWHQGVCDLYDVNLDDCKLQKPWQYALELCITHILQEQGMDDIVSYDSMWEAVNHATNTAEFWFNLEPYPWFVELYNLCKQVADEVYISSSPGLHGLAYAQKIWWLKRHLNIPATQVMLGSAKHLMARSDHLLIDDCEANVRKFVRDGGNAILFPQAWNFMHSVSDDEERMSYVRQELQYLVGIQNAKRR